MTLIELVACIGSMDGDATIYTAEPWTRDSKVIVAHELDSGGVPHEARLRGLKYFIEVAIARDFLDSWTPTLKRHPSIEEKCERLIQYVINDA
jgi:hypothetical protein